MPVDQLELVPGTDLPATEPSSQTSDSRYQVSTVLSVGKAYVVDTKPDMRSPLQQRIDELAHANTAPTLEALQSILDLPAAAYPYLLLEAAPQLYDAWQTEKTTLLIVYDPPTTTPLFTAFSTAIDPLQPVYWTHLLTDLWAGLEPVPQWRSSLLQADNLGVTADQSLYIHTFTSPNGPTSGLQNQEGLSAQPIDSQAPSPQLSDLQAFLKSLLALPHSGEVATLRQIRQLILAVTSANTIEQLRNELAIIGEGLLSTPAASTPQNRLLSYCPQLPQLGDSFTPQSPTSDSKDDSAGDEAASADPDDSAGDEAASADPSVDSLVEPSQSTLISELIDKDESVTVPMKLVALEEAGRTEVGRTRDHNEDFFSITSSYQKESDNYAYSLKAHCLYILCDGMGGHDGGEIASQLAAQTLSDYLAAHWPQIIEGDSEAEATLPDEDTIITAVKLANQAIYDLNEEQQRAGHERMGTTLVMLLLEDTSAVVAHVGDSRLYQHTQRNGLKQITADHEVGQREIQRGVDPAIAYDRPDAYQLTQALGPRSQSELLPSVTYLNFSEDTLLLLCSDGLSDNNLVEDHLSSHIDPILKEQKGIVAGMDDLIKLANDVNGHDNITGIVVRLKMSQDLASVQT